MTLTVCRAASSAYSITSRGMIRRLGEFKFKLGQSESGPVAVHKRYELGLEMIVGSVNWNLERIVGSVDFFSQSRQCSLYLPSTAVVKSVDMGKNHISSVILYLLYCKLC